MAFVDVTAIHEIMMRQRMPYFKIVDMDKKTYLVVETSTENEKDSCILLSNFLKTLDNSDNDWVYVQLCNKQKNGNYTKGASEDPVAYISKYEFQVRVGDKKKSRLDSNRSSNEDSNTMLSLMRENNALQIEMLREKNSMELQLLRMELKINATPKVEKTTIFETAIDRAINGYFNNEARINGTGLALPKAETKVDSLDKNTAETIEEKPKDLTADERQKLGMAIVALSKKGVTADTLLLLNKFAEKQPEVFVSMMEQLKTA